ncbi:4Fe-4S ferredoxin [Bordetella genomosp. 1]|uniref:4Fe-4S ferredoxin n=1 Tax=Bordetella genomosp. 1 TaxID=1395607 RepID=A0A261S7S4_9BORD|nr:4Fe-4S binding protein [Bordetella genomosp. 1]OZI33215.1 4Fe-4S ferredoxin [Bordetella genomosp. 1]
MNDSVEQSGASCKHPPGKFVPRINRNRCEGKGACVTVCPHNVFETGVLPAEERVGLTWLGKVKGFAHGWKQAFVPNADACEACGLCVTACPERAITLARS